MRRITLTAILLPALLAAFAACAVPAHAGVDEDFAFADALVDNGYFDHAREWYEKLREEATRDTVKARAELGLIGLSEAEARKIADPAEREAKLKEAIAGYEEFLAAYPDHPQAVRARFRLGQARQSLGNNLAKLLEDPGPDADVADLRKQAAEAFQSAEDLFGEMRTQIQEAHGTALSIETRIPKTEDPVERKELEQAFSDLMESRFRRLQCMYQRGILHDYRKEAEAGMPGEEPDAGSRKKILDAMLTESEEFLWDFEGKLPAYYVYQLRGQAWEGLREYRNAAVEFMLPAEQMSMEDLSALRNRGLLITAHQTRIMSYYLLGKAVRIGLAEERIPEDQRDAMLQEAIAKLDRMESEYRGMEDITLAPGPKDPFLRGRLEFARLLGRSGDASRGIEVCRSVSEAAGTDEWYARMADQVLAGLLGSGAGSADVRDPRILMNAADGLLGQREFAKAADMFAKAAEKAAGSRNEEDHALVPQALYKIGDCWFFAKDWDKAAAAYLRVAEEHASTEWGPKAALDRAQALQKKARATGASADERAYQDALNYIYENFKSAAPKVPFFLAQNVEESGANLVADGRHAEAVAKFDEAYTKYQDVERAAGTFYSDSLAKLGYVLYRKGAALAAAGDDAGADAAFEKALEDFEAYRTWSTGSEASDLRNTLGGEMEDNIRDNLAWTDYRAALVHRRLGQHDEAVALLEDFESTHPTAPALVMEAVEVLRFNSLVQSGRVEAAEKAWEAAGGGLTAELPARPTTHPVYQLAWAWAQRADKAEEESEEWQRAMDGYRRWLIVWIRAYRDGGRLSDIDTKHISAAANLAFGVEDYETAAEMLRTEMSRSDPAELAKDWQKQVALATCKSKLAERLPEGDKRREAYEEVIDTLRPYLLTKKDEQGVESMDTTVNSNEVYGRDIPDDLREAQGTIALMLADAYREVRAFRGKAEGESGPHPLRAQELYRDLANLFQDFTDPYWRCKYWLAWIYFELDTEASRQKGCGILENLRTITNDRPARIDELYEKHCGK